MHFIAGLAGLVLILLMLIDGFEAILLPRRVMHRFRFVRLFLRTNWRLWRAAGLRLRPGRRREAFLSLFGPLFLLGLFVMWILGLIIGFGLLHWAVASSVRAQGGPADLAGYLYMSGATFFTFGFGDLTPVTPLGRLLAIVEAGLGFGFLAIVISYLPVLFQASSRREVSISLLDARAGSPPTAAQVLLRAARAEHSHAGASVGGAGPGARSMEPFLAEWERWAAELLESHLSFPVLSYYRSQHDNQSWVAALTTVLDTCALLIVGVKCSSPFQAQLTFGMARHAAVDLCLVLNVPPREPERDRLRGADLEQLTASLREAGFQMQDDDLGRRLAGIRAMYEPFVEALARHFLFALPAFAAKEPVVDNWQRSAWMKRPPGIGRLPRSDATDEHF